MPLTAASRMESLEDRQNRKSPLLYPNSIPIDFPSNTVRQSTSRTETSTTADSTTAQSTNITSPPSTATEPSQRQSGAPEKKYSIIPKSPRSPTHQSFRVPPQPQKKKGSFLGTLFVKEPSSAALEQFAQQLIAQHGELSARAVPNVASSKMPENVPKVNTKWDGIPEAVKQKERHEKERRVRERRERERREEEGREKERAVYRRYSPGSSRNSPSTGPSESTRDSHGEVMQEHCSSESTLESYESQSDTAEFYQTDDGNLSRSSGLDLVPFGPNFKTALKKRPASLCTESLRSPSGTSLPEITSFFPGAIPDPPAVPTMSKHEKDVLFPPSEMESISSARSETPPVPDLVQPVSPSFKSPVKKSPVTPSTTFPLMYQMPRGFKSQDSENSNLTNQGPYAEGVVLLESGPNVLELPTSARRKWKLPADAFLAREARPFVLPDTPSDENVPTLKSVKPAKSGRSSEKSGAPTLRRSQRAHQELEERPDSSRARLGLRATVLKTSAAPWEVSERVKEDLEKRPDSSRVRLGLTASMYVTDAAPWGLDDKPGKDEWAAGTRSSERNPANNVLTSPKNNVAMKPKSYGIFGGRDAK